MYQRNIRGALRDALSDSPVVLVNGARQTGKSTLVTAFSDRERPAAYVTLDDATTLSAAIADSASFLAGFPYPVVIDAESRQYLTSFGIPFLGVNAPIEKLAGSTWYRTTHAI
jgi:chloramphenicol 3-O-phosphotransferase